MQTTVEVTRNEDGYVEAVYLLHETDQVVIAQIQTKDKYPEVGTFNDVVLNFISRNNLQIRHRAQVCFNNLPFDHGEIVYRPDRHVLYVTIFNFELLEQLSVPIGNSVSNFTIYESEEWKNK